MEITAGIGKTIDISSSGLVFRTEDAITPGSRMELSIAWPALLRGSRQARWVIFGNVVRSVNGLTACTIERCQFKAEGLTTAGNDTPRATLGAAG